MGLVKQTSFGVIWTLGEQMSRQGINALVTLLLARFLSPDDYGMIAMMAVFLAIGQSLMDSGFSQALIRQKDVSETDYATAFYANIVLGLVSYGLLFVSAPLIAFFYNTPMLVPLIRVVSLSIIINSFQVVQIAHFSRMLNFKIQMQASFPASLISGVLAVGMAYMGWGVWALISQVLCASLLKTVFLWLLQNLRPGRRFDWEALKKMYNFGYKMFLSGLLDTVFQNIYLVVIAKLFSASLTGLYFFANKIKDLALVQLISAIQSVTYPALSSVQHDPARLKQAYRKIVDVVTFILFPATLFLAALADPLFRLVFPSRWFPAVPYLQLICIASVFYPLHAVNLNVLKVKGRSDLFLRLEVFKKIALSLLLLVSSRYGIYGILIGQALGSVLMYIPNSYFSKQLISYPIAEQCRDFIPNLLLATAVSAVGYGVVEVYKEAHPLLLLLPVGGGMAGAYLLIAWWRDFPAIKLAEDLLIRRRLSEPQ